MIDPLEGPPQPKEPTKGGGSAAVWQVLRSLGQRPNATITDIAAEIGLHKSSVSRLLGGLREDGIVEWDDETSRYRLGLGLLALAAPLLAQADIIDAAGAELVSLSESTGESSSVMVWSGDGAVCVKQVISPQPVKHSCSLGQRFNTAQSASVQVFLAHTAPERVQRLLSDAVISGGQDRATGEPCRSYLERLAEVRARGWAVNASETSAQETSVAVPVRDSHGVCGAILVSAPSYRTPLAVVESHVRAAQQAASVVSRRMGGCAEA
ncbi:IclR family transcriptional regulator [Kocuria sp. ZOR0020]|uniref:IclR family transcriptional regulator n=1 Tax=Kocuria sp. ZOR0020 TaxID=1339234 RepID=UPI000689F167|nr:IclR family transcriptional regulator [Kocuria sp. ZOR0020]